MSDSTGHTPPREGVSSRDDDDDGFAEPSLKLRLAVLPFGRT